MEGSIQVCAFNPVTNKLFIGTSKDTGIYIPSLGNEKTTVDRKQVKSKVTCADWTSDGMMLAFGSMNGLVQVKDPQFEKKVNIQKLSAVSSIKWSPINPQGGELVLVVACMDQTISFHQESGEQIGFEKKVKYEVHSIDWNSTGDYFLAGGSSNFVSIFSRDGFVLQEVDTGYSWVASVRFQHSDDGFSVGGVVNGARGHIAYFYAEPRMPVSTAEDKYAVRVGLTEILVKDINSDRKAKFTSKELVKNICLFKSNLAVHSTSKITFYREYNPALEGAAVTSNAASQDMFAYKSIGKLDIKVDGAFFTLLAENFLLCKENRIKCYDFGRNLTREWVFDSTVTFLKSLGGPVKEECMIVGLKSGHVYKIFTSSPFPILLIEHGVEVRCLDMNISRKLLGVVDGNMNFFLYDIIRKESVSSEQKITQCLFSEDFDNIYSLLGESLLFIKSTEFEGVSVAASGLIISFKGSKIRLASGENISTVDIPLGGFLQHFLSKKDFKNSYKIACLGASDQDIKYLGFEALKNREFGIGRRCFTRTRDLGYLEIVNRCEEEAKQGRLDELGLKVELLCYDKKISKAVEILKSEGSVDKAIELAITMRKWPEAMDLIKNAQASGQLRNDKFNLFKLLKMQAESEFMKGNWKAAVDLLLSASHEARAIEILIKQDQEEQIINLMRRLTKSNHSEALRQCVKYFIAKKNHNAGKEALLKLGDQEELMKFHIELERWEEALMLANSDDSLKQLILLPYADWLAKNNRFDEASDYYKQAGRPDLAMDILKKLSDQSVFQERFKEAGQFHWILAKETLKSVHSMRMPSQEDKERIEKFERGLLKSHLYRAYSHILSYIRCPIKSEEWPGQHKLVFNSSRFILANHKSVSQRHTGNVSLAKVNYVLAKLANRFGGYKMARIGFEKLQSQVIAPEWVEEVEAQAVLARGKPLKDSKDAGLFCPRCRAEVQILTDGATCGNCTYPLVFAGIGYECLPLVEFTLGATDLTHEKIMEMVGTDIGGAKGGNSKRQTGKMWEFDIEKQDAKGGNAQSLAVEEPAGEEYSSRFGEKIIEACDLQIASKSHIKVKIDLAILKTLDPEDVFVMDLRKFCSDAPVRYFKRMDKEADIVSCQSCQQFYNSETFDLFYARTKTCPFCSSADTC